MIFSVAPTLGNGNAIDVPLSLFGTIQSSIPCSSCITAPSFLSPAICRSTGRGPNSHPPGKLILALPHRPSIAPRKSIDERISRESLSDRSQHSTSSASTERTSPSCVTLHPKFCSISAAAHTSESAGQLYRVVFPVSMVAAIIGSTAFFAP